MKYFSRVKGAEKIEELTKERARFLLEGCYIKEAVDDVMDNNKGFRLQTMTIAVTQKGEPMIKPIKVHPVESATIILWGDDRNKEHTLTKAKNCVASVISFDKRQIWEVYPYKRYSCDTEYCGACERKGMYIRLMPNDFKRIFGTDIVDRAERRTDESVD